METFSSGLGDGWGLTTDGTYLIATESSAKVHFLDPITMSEARTLTVTDRGRAIHWINEVGGRTLRFVTECSWLRNGRGRMHAGSLQPCCQHRP